MTERRQLPALLAGCLAGAMVFAVLLAAGLFLDQRLAAGSEPLGILVPLLFGAGGAYAGWLIGMLVYSAVRGPEPEAQEGG